MRKIFQRAAFLFFVGLFAISSCKKKNVSTDPKEKIDTCNYDMEASVLTSNGWATIFEENFDNDFSNWNIWEGGAYNNELQCYKSENMKIENGILSIAAKKENVTGPTTNTNSTNKSFGFTSGRIESKVLYSCNSTTPKIRFAARIKLPTGYGMWPAFWSYGANWPTNGEIDILEAKGSLPFQYATNYFYGTSPGVNLVTNSEKTILSYNSLTECWHVYEVIWEQNKFTFLFDGKIVDEKTGGYVSNVYNKLQMLTLNLAVGGDYFGNPPASSIETGTMYVDWVRVYKAL
jgi:beta-glucanase (GH16 family)